MPCQFNGSFALSTFDNGIGVAARQVDTKPTRQAAVGEVPSRWNREVGHSSFAAFGSLRRLSAPIVPERFAQPLSPGILLEDDIGP